VSPSNVPEVIADDEPLVRSIHYSFGFDKKKGRLKPNAFLNSEKRFQGCSVTRLRYASWEFCVQAALQLDEDHNNGPADSSKEWFGFLVLCVSSPVLKALRVKHDPVKDQKEPKNNNPAHALLDSDKELPDDEAGKIEVLDSERAIAQEIINTFKKIKLTDSGLQPSDFKKNNYGLWYFPRHMLHPTIQTGCDQAEACAFCEAVSRNGLEIEPSL